jgi:hypothetical protein
MIDLLLNISPTHYHATFGVAAVVAIGLPLVVGGINAGVQKGKSNKAEEERQNQENKLNAIQANRQEVINKSGDIRALKSQVSNPYANMSVATEAAEFEAEQTDMALANTLDAMVSSGASAGGATALARAALQSKKGLSASIEKQEVANAKMAADGAKQMEQQLINLEKAAIGEEVNAYNRQETRDLAEIGRVQDQMDYQQMRRDDLSDASTEAMMAGLEQSAAVGTEIATMGIG